jgi:hypothetical protein
MQAANLLLDLSDNVFGRTSRRLDGLTDAELLWDPTSSNSFARLGDGRPEVTTSTAVSSTRPTRRQPGLPDDRRGDQE